MTQNLLVLEFITGGGLYNAPLPDSLAAEGELMLKALLADLAEIPNLHLSTTRDARLSPLNINIIQVSSDPWPIWQSAIDQADWVWPIAPETDGVLEKLSRMVPPHKLIGSAPQAIHIAASKHATAQHLNAIPTYWVLDAPNDFAAYVAKPDDGAGCGDTRYFDDFYKMQTWLQTRPNDIVQPWLNGEPASISMLCREGVAYLLSCNRQLIERDKDGFIYYRGSVINGMVEHWNAFDVVAQQVAKALPQLAGYVGVDVMVDGDCITVLEINPRLTTSYVGLRQATGLNPARLVLDVLYNGIMAERMKMQRNVVEVNV
ncbi:MAG: ATP-grasp domain-containing protein [Methylophilaceae bacterium]